MSNFNVTFYETIDRECPVEKFIDDQDVKMQAKIYRNLLLLEEYGNNLRLPYSRHLDDGIFELRTQSAGNTTRILYFFVVDKEIIVTNGFTKKTQKTPPLEIELAKKYRFDYFKQSGVSK